MSTAAFTSTHLGKQMLILCLSAFLTQLPLQAQYFGQNKTSYRSFDFKTMRSENFAMYYYLPDSIAKEFLNNAEKWYRIHQQTLQDTIDFKNPLILYNNHADFQQTTIFNQTISVGTGGVTEGMKNRVVMPYTHAKKETNHVLGHELVHAFQFNILKTKDSLGLNNTQNIPLWVIEGMAEFLSIGREDPHTAMWIRDAIHHDFFPSVNELGRNPRYFPYRYGHAFWAFVAGTWGEDIIKPLFVNMARYGVETAMLRTLGYDSKSFSKLWKEASENYYKPYLQEKEKPALEILFDDNNSGRTNIIPSISPDGEKIVFLSEKDIISLDFYLADVTNKKITKKIQSINRASHIDFVSFIESAATWSPDSRQFALVVYAKGKNILIVVDAKKGKIVQEYEMEDVYSFAHPSWSPDGSQIVVSGMRNGISDLYSLSLATGTVRALTQDPYSDIHPRWSPDGQYIVFSSDRPLNTPNPSKTPTSSKPPNTSSSPDPTPPSNMFYVLKASDSLPLTNTEPYIPYPLISNPVLKPSHTASIENNAHHKEGSFRLCVLEIGAENIQAPSEKLPSLQNGYPETTRQRIIEASSSKIEVIPVFPQADNLNPHMTTDNGILFLSDRDGYRNLYKYDRISEQTYRMTDYPTGISGITKYSAALSYAPSTATVYFNLYTNGKYQIVKSALQDFSYLPVDHTQADRSPGFLPPKIPLKEERITPTVQAFSTLRNISPNSIQLAPYTSRFGLEYITSTGVGVAVNSTFGAGASGGVLFVFGDVLKYHQLGFLVAVNGEIYDVAAGASYIYRKPRIDWGIQVSHIPYVFSGRSIRDIDGNKDGRAEQREIRIDIIRNFQERIGILSYFPLSKIKRIEAQLGLTYYHYRVDRITDVYVRTQDSNSFVRVREKRTKLRGDDLPDNLRETLFIYNISAAYVGDNSRPGLVGPISGYRYRAEINQYFGHFFYPEIVLDGRYYHFFKPFTAAIRGIHIGRYLKDGENERFNPLNIAFPTFVRGYNYLTAYRNRRTSLAEAVGNSSGRFRENNYVGSKLFVANFELRVPFTGPKRLALIPSQLLFTQLALFGDAGVAIASRTYKQRLFDLDDVQAQELGNNTFDPIFSVGLSLRINLFGVYIIEPFYAIPFQRVDLDRTGIFGINLFPAW